MNSQQRTHHNIGELVNYRGRSGRIVEAAKNDRGYGVVRDEMRARRTPSQWVSNLGMGGEGKPGDGGEMYRLEPA